MAADQSQSGGPELSVLAGALLLASLAGVMVVAEQPARRPDVILVVVDTLRADHLSHYGYGRPTGGGLDAFAGRATRYTQAYAPSPWTGTSTASIFTGLFATRHGVRRPGDRLDDELTTLPEILHEQGWHTVAHSLNVNVSKKTGYAQGFDLFNDFLGTTTDYPHIDAVLERVDRWLDARPERPFFLYLHSMNTHGPYRVPEDHRRSLLGREPSRDFVYYGSLMASITSGRSLPRRREVGPAYLASLVDQYDTAVRYTSDALGELFADLARRGLYDDALVIVTSDHGEELFDHGGFSHGYSLHGEVLRVPLYVKLPRQREGAVVDARVSLMDLAPTILQALGIDATAAFDGLPLPATTEAGAARSLLHVSDWKKRCVGRALLSGRYKLIELESNYEGLRNATRLYDVEADPAETLDLAAHKPELVAQLRRELEDAFARAQSGHGQVVPANVLEDMDRERLKALGYLK
jgi:arylsulfatase A-like enzyme